MRPRGAPKGSRNAAKEKPGIRGTFYLNAEELDIIDAMLRMRPVEYTPTDANRLEYARQLMHEAIQKLK